MFKKDIDVRQSFMKGKVVTEVGLRDSKCQALLIDRVDSTRISAKNLV